MPFLSIISINSNNSIGLRRTIESVIDQTSTDFEYLIIDGGSIDSSLDLIKTYVDKITWWVSEPDTGIYHAMNKGILKATGEYCLFLNSGDFLIDENVIRDFYKASFNEDIISGNACADDGRRTVWESARKKDLNFNFFYENSLPHRSTFIKRDLFTVYGLYNENYQIVSDWEFFLKRLLIDHCTYAHFDRPITLFDINGISSRPEMRPLQEKEKEDVFRTILPSFIYESFKEVWNEVTVLKSHEAEYREYMTLKHGKFSCFLRLLLFLKKTKRNLKIIKRDP